MRAAEVAHVSERHRLVVQELVSAPRKRKAARDIGRPISVSEQQSHSRDCRPV